MRRVTDVDADKISEIPNLTNVTPEEMEEKFEDMTDILLKYPRAVDPNLLDIQAELVPFEYEDVHFDLEFFFCEWTRITPDYYYKGEITANYEIYGKG